MDQKLQDLFKKINYDETNYEYFKTCKIEKIVIKKNLWTVYLINDTTFLIDVIESFKECLKENIDKSIDLKIVINVLNPNMDLFKDYYINALKNLNNNGLYLSMFSDRLMNDGDFFVELYNTSEEKTFNKIITNINEYLNDNGFTKKLVSKVNKEKQEFIKEEIRKDIEIEIDKKNLEKEVKEKIKEKRTTSEKSENSILGRPIKGNPIKISDINYEDNNIVVDVEIFGVDYFESSKTNFKIITLKITDKTSSMLAKVFCRDDEDFNYLKKELKPGLNVRISGYTKNDTFAKDLVLNVRDIEKIEIKKEKRKDLSERKRVELHTHTKMSQMDGICDCTSLLKQAIAFNHKAIAITDHNGGQSFPDAYRFVTGYNKKLKEGEEPFKVIYGTEVLLIDDSVSLVVRANNNILLDEEYVVFDLETTGFNAGGQDSIIEIGAVKLKNGEIIDKYDILINPGHPLLPKITELTGITDKMLEDCPNEEEAVKDFMKWVGSRPMVAHNAKFDTSFIEMAHKKYNMGEFSNPVLDTLEISRVIDSNQARHSLSALVKRYNIPFDEESHHRGDYDAEATAHIFHKMLLRLNDQNIEKMSDIEKMVSKDEIHKFGQGFHVNVLVKNKEGLKNLFKIISLSNTTYLHKTPRILRSKLNEHREGLLIGSGCYESEVFRQARTKSDDELINIINFYDYVEIQPLDCYSHLLDMSDFANKEELIEVINKIIRLTKDAKKIIVATGDVHHINKEDKIYREIIVNQKVPGGGRHPLARSSIKEIPSMHFRTTDEMLEDFSFLGDDLAYEIVVENSNKIADLTEIVEVIVQTGGVPFSPRMENSKEIVKKLVYDKAHSMYGDSLPKIVEDRITNELTGIINGGFDVIYLIAQKLVKHSNDDGYLVGSRGSVGSSFVATMMSITEVNPLPAHYLCKKCKYSEFENEAGDAYGQDYSSGYDLPNKKCPVCGEMLGKEGQDMPFATFLGFNADKVPDIDLNFSGDYQWIAHEYTKELFGVDNVYRAGTIGTVAEKTAYGYVKGYFEDKNLPMPRSVEIERLAIGCTGVKRTTGQHPGGIVVVPDYKDVYDFTPYQFPADDNTSLWRTTHFDYHSIEEDLLKLDILGHDDPTILKMLGDLTGIDVTTLPMDDEKVLSLLLSPKALGLLEEDINCPTGTLGLPELGTKFVINMLSETKPKSFGELVKISGLSHGTDVWNGNAQELIKNKVVEFKDVIGCRDDIMVYLSYNGLEPLDAFKIMEFVRKGRASKDPETWKIHEENMRNHNIEDWFIESCRKIKYMFPKAHACAYVMSAIRIAWFKIYRPLEYYASYFSIRSDDFDIDTMIKGRDAIKEKIKELSEKGYDATNKEASILSELEIALEMTSRGLKFGEIDLYKSDYRNFVIDKETNSLIPPFRSIDGFGEIVAKNVVLEREKMPFISIEDLQKRGRVSSTLIDKMRIMGILDGMDESSQLTLF